MLVSKSFIYKSNKICQFINRLIDLRKGSQKTEVKANNVNDICTYRA